MGSEGLELLGVNVSFLLTNGPDEILEQLADPLMIDEMKKVFFSDGANSLGHSYAKLMSGPGGRHDLQDVVALLRTEPLTKRAVVNFSSEPGGKVPCISAVQFLVRTGAVHVMYFARGQDAYKKFYADGLCLAAMAERVAAAVGMQLGVARGFIGSSHVYDSDMAAIRQTIARSKHFKAEKPNERVKSAHTGRDKILR
jgi:thymidylate synthase